jgi:hypothetical protein
LELELPAFRTVNSAAINEQQNESGAILSDFEMTGTVLLRGINNLYLKFEDWSCGQSIFLSDMAVWNQERNSGRALASS